MPDRSQEDKYWETWSHEDFRSVQVLVDQAQMELSCAASRSFVPGVRERASRIELALRAVGMMLQDPSLDHKNYIQTKLGLGIGYYGLRIVDTSPEIQPDDNSDDGYP